AMHHGQVRIPPHGRLIQTKMRAQAVVEKILLLPKVELFAELALEPQAGALKALSGADMQFADFKKRGLVEWAPPLPRRLTPRPQVFVPEVLYPNQPLGGIVKINCWNIDFRSGEKFRNLDIVAILLLLAGILHQDDAILPSRADPIILSLGSSLLKGGDLYLAMMIAGESFLCLRSE